MNGGFMSSGDSTEFPTLTFNTIYIYVVFKMLITGHNLEKIHFALGLSDLRVFPTIYILFIIKT